MVIYLLFYYLNYSFIYLIDINICILIVNLKFKKILVVYLLFIYLFVIVVYLLYYYLGYSFIYIKYMYTYC